jgi:hypothetical protein
MDLRPGKKAKANSMNGVSASFPLTLSCDSYNEHVSLGVPAGVAG